MIHKDYLEELIENFVSVVERTLFLATQNKDPEMLIQTEAQVAKLLELDPSFALNLSPESLVVMLQLNGVGYSLASYAAFVLDRCGDVYTAQGKEQLADLRHKQALGIAKGFNISLDDVPPELTSLNESLKNL